MVKFTSVRSLAVAMNASVVRMKHPEVVRTCAHAVPASTPGLAPDAIHAYAVVANELVKAIEYVPVPVRTMRVTL